MFDVRYENDTSGFPSRPAVWESVVAIARFREGRVLDVRMLPIDLGDDRPRSQRGTPRLAGPDLAGEIIERLSRLSPPLGTRIEMVGGVGVIHHAQ